MTLNDNNRIRKTYSYFRSPPVPLPALQEVDVYVYSPWYEQGPNALMTTGSLAIGGSPYTFASASGTDVFFYVSGTIGLSGTIGKRAVFGGDLYVSGALLGGATVSPSGGDDRLALQAAIAANAAGGPSVTLLSNARYYVSYPGLTLLSGTSIDTTHFGRATILPYNWTPAVSSSNDPSFALVSATALTASSGTTLSGNHRGGAEYITVATASLLSISAGDWIRIYTSRAQGGDVNGEGGAERYDVLQVRSEYSASSNTIPLVTRLRCFHASGAEVKKITNPISNINISNLRLDASSGSMPVLLQLTSVTDSKIDVEVRGASHAAVHSRYGSIRNTGNISDDGERNCALMLENSHDSTFKVNSTGKGARFHRYGRIRGLVHIHERCNDVWITDSALKNGCTGLTQKGAINGGLRNSTINNMRLKERIARPWVMLITANTSSDLVTLFATGASPNDTNELRLNDRVMFVSTTTLPAPLTAQTVYYAVNTTNTTVQLATTPGGTPIDITTTGGSFGEMCVSSRLVTVGASSVLTCKSHGFEVGDEVRFIGVAPFPTGLTSGTSYYIRSVPSADTFTLSATQGGSLLSVTNDGSGILSVERNRAVPAETFSRTGIVWVAGAGFECHGGGQPDATAAERTMGFKIDNVELSDCYHPDGGGNQGSALIVDVVSLYTNNLRIINRGRTDLLSVPPGDDHMFGMLFWDNSLITHNGLVIEGCEMGLIFLGGWNRQIFNGCTLNGADGQSNPGFAIINGHESAAGSSQPVDIVFKDLSFSGYTYPIYTHPTTWFAPTDYSWSRFRFDELHILGNGDIAHTYRDVRTCKNVTSGTLVAGDIVKMASFTDVNGYKLFSVTGSNSTEPQGTGVVVYNPGNWPNNSFCLVAFGDAVATVETADTPVPGDFLYTQNGSKKLTTGSAGSRAKGIALAGKLNNLIPFRCLT